MQIERTGEGLGCTGTLLLIFIVLKLTGNIDWSWWWVLSPLWISLAVLALVGLVVLLANIPRRIRPR